MSRLSKPVGRAVGSFSAVCGLLGAELIDAGGAIVPGFSVIRGVVAPLTGPFTTPDGSGVAAAPDGTANAVDCEGVADTSDCEGVGNEVDGGTVAGGADGESVVTETDGGVSDAPGADVVDDEVVCDGVAGVVASDGVAVALPGCATAGRDPPARGPNKRSGTFTVPDRGVSRDASTSERACDSRY
jgi:hypothetical protein